MTELDSRAAHAQDTAAPPAPAARAPARAGALLARGLRALDAELAAALARVLAPKGADDEAIHDLRVAIRRLRTLLKLARPVFGRFHADAVREGFTRVHRATGTLRDEEVLEETLADLGVPIAAFTHWCTRRKSRERTLRRGVVLRIKSGELGRARKLLAALVLLPVEPKRDRAASKLARKALERARNAVEALRDVPPENVTGLHDLRIAYKGLRYTAELLAPALPADLAAMAEPASKFQKVLGQIHDVDVAILSIRRARGLDHATRMEVLRHLDAARAKKVAKYLDAMAPPAPAPELSSSASNRSGRSRSSSARSP